MADIVLKNRNGEKIDYPSIDYLNVKTLDGETKGYAAYDPETLVPENLASGVVVGDVEGTMSVPQGVETTIDPNFSAGDMEIVPEAGKMFSKVGVLKPANLTPINIAKDVNIAGVVGTMESGGGMSPYMFVAASFCGMYKVLSANYTCSANSITIPASATVLNALFYHGYSQKSTAPSSSSSMWQAITTMTSPGLQADLPTITKSDTGIKISGSFDIPYSSSSKYCIFVYLLEVLFTMPGIYVYTNEENTLDVYADDTFVEIPQYCNLVYKQATIRRMDLSNSVITSIPSYAFYYNPVGTIHELLLPSTITTIASSAMVIKDLRLLDLSKATSVPTLSGTLYSSGFASDFQIRVPASLYNDFIAATNWSTYADYIVAV